MLGPGIERIAQEAVEQPHHAGNGILRQMRIGHVALLALHDDPAGQRSAAPDLDHVAKPVGIRRLAEDAVIEPLPAGPRPVEKLDGAVDRRPLLVAGDQEADGAFEIWRSAMNRRAAAIMQAIPPFMSTAPRP